MCDQHGSNHFIPFMFRGMHHSPGKMGMMCCTSSGQSKETRIKQLEALKSQLQDHINGIDVKISELESEEKVEAQTKTEFLVENQDAAKHN